MSITLAVLIGITLTGSFAAGAIVPEQPRLDTPIVLDGEVWAVEQVGNAVVVGGNFTQIQTTRDGPIIDQAGVFAYDMDSGILLEDFLPTLTATNNAVEIKSIVPAADGRSAYIGGRFTAIDDHTDDRIRVRNRIALIDVPTGRLDRNFAQGGVDAKVLTMDLIGDQLYVGGNFTYVYDTDVDRPAIQHDHHSFARFDATTGAYDATFKFQPETSIAVSGLLGVTNISHTADNSTMVFTHRGTTVTDVGRGVTLHRPGITLLDLNAAGGPEINGFHALYPDADDPIQDFYHLGQCGNRGILIRDMEISPDGSYFVTTHQGADTGYQCDTTVRWPITDTPERPTWVARVFDSVFSVGIADDAIYIGGHFRMMVHPDSPSTYPGETRTNGQAGSDIYQAVATNAKFKADLYDPGYVYEANQVGAIDPATGKGIPTWNPGSDAAKCVCVITVIDRGLLLGQDNGRVNGFLTGRAAFLDLTPDVGDPECSVALDEDRNPNVTWTNIGDVSTWSIARNGSFVGSSVGDSAVFVDTGSPIDTDLTYELRFNRNGIAQTDDCGTVRIDIIPITCTVTPNGDGELRVDWNTSLSDSYAVRRDGTYLGSATDITRWDDTGLDPSTTYSYEIRAFDDGVANQSTTCEGTTTARPLECVVSVEGYDVTVAFNGEGFNRVTIRRDGNWQATLTDGETSYTQTLDPGTYVYDGTGVVSGFSDDADCGTAVVVIAPLVCEAMNNNGDVTVNYNGEDYDRVTIRRDTDWQATLTDGETSYTQLVEAGTYTYTVTGKNSGSETTSTCGTVTIDPPTAACLAQNRFGANNPHIFLTWNDVGATSYQVRTNGTWAITLDAGSTSWRDYDATVDTTYQLRYKVNGQQVTVDCA